MSKVDAYRQTLQSLKDWDAYLLQESRLPGPRGNLELARAVAEEGDRALFERYLTLDAGQAPTNTPHEFLAFCGVLGLGKLLAQGKLEVLETLRTFASDPRWRTREAVAMALQRWGKADMSALLEAMEQWSGGSPLEQRAAAAALCEPSLLQNEKRIVSVLQILDSITAALSSAQDRRSEQFRVLRKGLGYCWSVAVCALPEDGKKRMERWFASDDPDVRWVMVQNLGKKRLERMDAEWVAAWQAAMGVKRR